MQSCALTYHGMQRVEFRGRAWRHRARHLVRALPLALRGIPAGLPALRCAHGRCGRDGLHGRLLLGALVFGIRLFRPRMEHSNRGLFS